MAGGLIDMFSLMQRARNHQSVVNDGQSGMIYDDGAWWFAMIAAGGLWLMLVTGGLVWTMLNSIMMVDNKEQEASMTKLDREPPNSEKPPNSDCKRFETYGRGRF